AEEKGIIQGYVDGFYNTFVERVATGRGLRTGQVDSIGQGRVWTGADALRIGLVDELGGMVAATEEAARMAGLEEGDYRIVGYPEQKDIFEELTESLNLQTRALLTRGLLGEDADLLHRIDQVQSARRMSGIQARLPFAMELY